ncbi:uncharacterized protein LOC128870070 [Anastrepha ludens]|uniref:uncharacterized protein LOC128870070 n=1 Tax=Anastrepha ludens TaxID=28586 RepID=UPI0023AFBAD3|nr:uncharacterized protein LOC128870070 [Anastrepha ludens]
MDKTTKYFDSSSIKKSSPRHNSTFNSTVEEAILVSTNAAPLRQIAAQSEMTAASPIVPPPYTPNFQDVRSENIVLIPTPSSLEQYRLQLYNYALSIDRLRWPQYTAAAAIPATTYDRGSGTGVHLLVNGESNHAFGSAPATTAHGNRLALSMSLFPQRIFHTEEPKPQYSYIGLIAMAILSSAEAKLVLSDIYQYILDNYPYFRARGPGWRNSIRHNLSLNDCFIKSGRSANGKGHYWAIHPANIDDFRKGDFRRRKAQRKVRKHMGLSLDDAGTDSPSPPPLDLTSTPLTSAPASAIASLYSQTRKRQFDVASLLAPDRTDFARKISTTGRHTPPSFEESTALQPMFIKKNSHENVKECHQQQQDAPTHVQALRSSYSCSNRQAFPTNSVSHPQRLLTLDEQDQDEIDVEANDIEEQSKKPYSKLADKDDEDPYDAVEEEERRVVSDTKSDSSSGTTQVYVDGENECIIDATVHKIPISRQQPSSLPGAVIEWHMLRPQLTSEEKNSQQFSASSNKSTISQKDYKECYATKIISSTTVTPIAAPKVVTSSTSVDCNWDPNSSINQTELYSHAQNSILPNTVIHRNQHVRRLMHHLHQQHTHHDALEELADETAQAFGHYYGTYMAAAARRIGTMQLTQIQHQFPVKHPQLQQQEASHQDPKIWH